MKTKTDILGKDQLRKLEEEKDEEKDPSTKRRREHIDYFRKRFLSFQEITRLEVSV